MSSMCLIIAKWTLGKWIFGKILDYWLVVIKTQVKQPALLAAFDCACRNILADGVDKVPLYTLKSLGYSGGLPESEAMLSRFEPYLQEGRIPNPREMVEILTDLWRIRKQRLEPSEAESFFRLPEDEARKVIEKLAKNFLLEVLNAAEIKDMRIPMKSATYYDPKRPPVPGQSGHLLR